MNERLGYGNFPISHEEFLRRLGVLPDDARRISQGIVHSLKAQAQLKIVRAVPIKKPSLQNGK